VLVYNKTGELPGNLLEQYPEITSLQATNLELTGFSHAFQTKHDKLKHLDLSSNHLSELGSFLGLKNLETLSLANNRLEKLEPIRFYGLEKLQSLNLSHNRLQHLNALVFYYVKEVRELKLNHNQLDIVNFMLFAKMVKMALLDLSNNQIKKIEKIEKIQYHANYENFGSHSLEHLDLEHNRLQSFNFNEIPNFGSLVTTLRYLITKKTFTSSSNHYSKLLFNKIKNNSLQFTLYFNYWLHNIKILKRHTVRHCPPISSRSSRSHRCAIQSSACGLQQK
jgi:Leucine-rich repeat (LRR) protein